MPQDLHNLKFPIIENTFAGETFIQNQNLPLGTSKTEKLGRDPINHNFQKNHVGFVLALDIDPDFSLAFSHRGGGSNRKLSFFQLLIFKMSASLKMSIILSRTVEKFVELPFENI